MRTINDRVYGEIAVSDVASRLLSNRWLVRLDGIRQLGACSFVYPSATHTRREHSIGVYHLSGIMASHVQTIIPSITHEDVEMVRIAGLLHDVGHGPFSHMYESFLCDRGGSWCHEEQAVRILTEEIMEELYELKEWTHTRDENLVFLTGLISGTLSMETGRDPMVVHALADVVHSHAGVDADRMDYLLRDTLCVFGSTHTVDATRIIHSIRIVNGRIAFSCKVSLSIQQLFDLRTRLHKQVYQHRDVLVVERLLKEHMTDAHVASTLDEFCALTDASVLQMAPLCRLHRYPRMHRVPLDLVLPTHPLCKCGHEFLHHSNFCPMCGSSEEPLSFPIISSAEATEHVRNALTRPNLVVLIADVTQGVLDHVPFHCNGAPKHLVDDGRPLRCRQRTVYCYLNDDEGEEGVLNWREREHLGELVNVSLKRLWF